LEGILYKRVVAGTVQQEGIQRIGVGVINLFKSEGHSKGGRAAAFNLFRKNDKMIGFAYRPIAEAFRRKLSRGSGNRELVPLFPLFPLFPLKAAHCSAGSVSSLAHSDGFGE